MPICESCGREETSVAKVQRMYLADTIPEDQTAQSATLPRELDPQQRPTAGDIESWCASCCASFPHVVIDPG